MENKREQPLARADNKCGNALLKRARQATLCALLSTGCTPTASTVSPVINIEPNHFIGETSAEPADAERPTHHIEIHEMSGDVDSIIFIPSKAASRHYFYGKSSFSDGIGIASKHNGHHFFHIDEEGARLYEGTYKALGVFHDGLAYACDYNDECFHINETGSPAYTQRFQSTWHFIGKYAIAARNGQHFHINKQGSPIYTERFDDTEPFYEGRAKVKKNGARYHIFENGKPAYTRRFYDVSLRFTNGIAVAKDTDQKTYHINTKGERAYQKEYVYVSEFYQGLAVVKEGTKELHINTSGNPTYENRFDSVEDFEGKFAVATLNGESFHIRKNGKPAYSARYLHVGPMINERAWASNGNGFFIIKSNGEPISGRLFSGPGPRDPRYMPYFENGIARVGDGNEMYYIDDDDRIIMDDSFEYASDFTNDTAVARKNGKWYVLKHRLVYPSETAN